MSQGKVFSLTLLRNVCSEIVLHHSYKTITQNYRVAKSTLQKYRHLLKKANIDRLEDVILLTDIKLAKIIYGTKADIKVVSRKAVVKLRKTRKIDPSIYIPDFTKIALNYAEHPYMRKADLYVDYVEKATQEGMGHVKLHTFYKELNKKILAISGPNIFLHRNHPYGDELELDWCGDTYQAKDEEGKLSTYHILVLTWAASYYTYVTFVKDQSTKTTIEGIKEALEYFNCLPKQLLIDNPKSLVLKHKIGQEAILQPDFAYFMKNCCVMVNANTPCKSNEKSAVENSVHLVQTRVLTRLTPKTNISRAKNELMRFTNIYINFAPFRGNEANSRFNLFCKFEFPCARKILFDLPGYIEHQEYIKVPSNYHIKIKNNYYSVPFSLAGKYVETDIYDNKIIVRHNDSVVAQHPVVSGADNYTTDKEHMPNNHRLYAETEEINTAEDIFNLSKDLSSEIVAFCMLLLVNKDNFAEIKKACISIINTYKKLKNDMEKNRFNKAISNLIKKGTPGKFNTYNLYKELQTLTCFE
ncbi:MAG: Mu transposase domain-containing protein [Succinivibrio sp.]